jgi:signal transduction histidine kinase
MFKAFFLVALLLKTSIYIKATYQISFFKVSLFFVAIVLVWSCENPKLLTKGKSQSEIDSISYWVNQTNSSKLAAAQKKKFLEKAFENTVAIQSDSLKNKYLGEIAIQAEYLNIDELFKKANKESLITATRVRDLVNIGSAHWNYGNFYTDAELIDSAYYHFNKAYENFEEVKHDYWAGKMLYNMAFIQGRLKDYTGSEILIFEAISKFEKLNRYDRLYDCYNYLGLIYMELEELDKSIFYNTKALDFLSKVKNKRSYKEGSLNNLGLTYRKKKEYNKAIQNFEKAITNRNLKKVNANLYARLIDNIAYTKFLNGDTTDVFKNLNYAISIRDSLKDHSGMAISKRHLSEFYAANRDTIKAIELANEAFEMADLVDNNRDKLETLLLLSKVDKENSNKYLSEYVHLNDSLYIEERKIRNKFTRIRFETDEYIEETEKLSEQNIFIIIGSVLSLLLLAFAYIVRVQRARNKELIFEREQQKSNEEIVTLMRKQQSKLEEGRLKERHRISEDLHDGVLSKIFGTRLGLGFLNVKGNDETIEKQKFYIDELQNIEKEIRTISHELKSEILASEENFSKIIKDLVSDKSKIGNFEYRFESDKNINWDNLDDAIKVNFYRIIQEALQNIIKYARASFVEIRIELRSENIILDIKDNGTGFNIARKRNGIGLKNMRSRAAKLNGFFQIESKPKKGTHIFVECPLLKK